MNAMFLLNHVQSMSHQSMERWRRTARITEQLVTDRWTSWRASSTSRPRWRWSCCPSSSSSSSWSASWRSRSSSTSTWTSSSWTGPENCSRALEGQTMICPSMWILRRFCQSLVLSGKCKINHFHHCFRYGQLPPVSGIFMKRGARKLCEEGLHACHKS